MNSITLRLNGLDSLSLKVRYLREAARDGLKLGVQEGAFIVETEAKTIVPVDTGRLRDSIHTEVLLNEPERQTLQVIPDTPYAARIEFGFTGTDSLGRHYDQPPQPYMRPARDAKEAEALDAIRSGVYEQVDSAASAVALKRLR